MKKTKQILATFFALYLLVLLVMPCHDNCNASIEPASLTIEQAQNHHEEDNGTCSPFCICSCCATHIVVQHIAGFDPDNIFFIRVFNSFYQSFFSSTYHAIWQPPKLA
ncbi:MAG: DUF6660 family protein [Bacteroidia bacterium]